MGFHPNTSNKYSINAVESKCITMLNGSINFSSGNEGSMEHTDVCTINELIYTSIHVVQYIGRSNNMTREANTEIRGPFSISILTNNRPVHFCPDLFRDIYSINYLNFCHEFQPHRASEKAVFQRQSRHRPSNSQTSRWLFDTD